MRDTASAALMWATVRASVLITHRVVLAAKPMMIVQSARAAWNNFKVIYIATGRVQMFVITPMIAWLKTRLRDYLVREGPGHCKGEACK